MVENCKHFGMNVTQSMNVGGSEAGNKGKVRTRSGWRLPCTPRNSDACSEESNSYVSPRTGCSEAERTILASDLGLFTQVLMDWANSSK